MGANPQPIQSKSSTQPGKVEALSRSRRPGYFEHQHDWCEVIAWVAQKSAVAAYLLTKILSLSNQRAAKLANEQRPQTGCTGLFEIKQFAWPDSPDKLPRDVLSLSPWEARNFQLALNDLAERGLIQKYSRQEAIDANLITKAEAGRPRDAYVVRPLTDKWKEIAADLAAAAAEDLRSDDSDDEPEETDPAEPEIIQVHDEPLVLMPGQKSRPLTLSDAVHKRWSRCKTVEFDLSAPIPLEHRFTIHGETIRCSILEFRQTKGEIQTKPISLGAPEPAKPEKRRKGETETKCISLEPVAAEKRQKGEDETKCNSLADLADFLTPIFSRYVGSVPDPKLLVDITTALEGCPLENLDGACYGRVVRATLNEFERKRKPIESGLFLWCARKAAEQWKTEPAKPQPPRQDDSAATLRAALAADEAERKRRDEMWATVPAEQRKSLIATQLPAIKKRYPLMTEAQQFEIAEKYALREFWEAATATQTC